MKAIPWRVQLAVVAAGYVAVLLLAALLVFGRYMLYVNHSQDAAAAGGMYAFGDVMLELFIVGLFLIPTFFLVIVIRKSEMASTKYSQALLALSLTAPISLGVLLIPSVNQGNSFVGWFCLYRLFALPVMVVGLLVSRLLARFQRAKRLASYALMCEVGTFFLAVALFMFSAMTRQG